MLYGPTRDDQGRVLPHCHRPKTPKHGSTEGGSSRLSEADARRLNVGFWQGAALQFVNIKAWLLALTIVAGWVAGHGDSLQRLAVVLPVMVFFAFSSNLTYAAVGALLRQWLAQGRRLLWFNRAMALVLVATAAWMVAA